MREVKSKKKVLMVANQSGRKGGGIPVVCMQLCAALSDLGHEVTLLVTSVDSIREHGRIAVAPPDISVMERLAAQIAETGPGASPHRPSWTARMPETVKVLEAAVETLSPEELGIEGKEFDLVIGHTRFSGRAAINVRDRWFPQAKYAHIVHTSPRGIFRGGTKAQWKSEEESEIERGMMRGSDLVVGVGPLLSAEARRQSNAVPGQYGIHEVIPAFEMATTGSPGGEVRRGGPLVLYLAGRADDPLKGVEDITRAISLARRRGVAVVMKVRGIPGDQERKDFQAKMDGLVGESGIVSILPYTSSKEELERDKLEADAAVMPSTHEGFGMSASEAAALGLPVLTTSDSGISMFLGDAKRFPVGSADRGVVPDGRKEERTEAWAQAIQHLSEQLPARKSASQGLAELLRGYTWKHAASSLVEAVDSPSRHGYTAQDSMGGNRYQPNELSNLAAKAVRKNFLDQAQPHKRRRACSLTDG